ncbi:hypothetical protein niasHS_009352 [Heterodera schachtii]|uniref:Secreted protein n=1 Tax=Heterodera schachtii TaxID=97005 RepID=A0ABD2JBR5_HETSC
MLNLCKRWPNLFSVMKIQTFLLLFDFSCGTATAEEHAEQQKKQQLAWLKLCHCSCQMIILVVVLLGSCPDGQTHLARTSYSI